MKFEKKKDFRGITLSDTELEFIGKALESLGKKKKSSRGVDYEIEYKNGEKVTLDDYKEAINQLNLRPRDVKGFRISCFPSDFKFWFSYSDYGFGGYISLSVGGDDQGEVLALFDKVSRLFSERGNYNWLINESIPYFLGLSVANLFFYQVFRNPSHVLIVAHDSVLLLTLVYYISLVWFSPRYPILVLDFGERSGRNLNKDFPKAFKWLIASLIIPVLIYLFTRR